MSMFYAQDDYDDGRFDDDDEKFLDAEERHDEMIEMLSESHELDAHDEFDPDDDSWHDPSCDPRTNMDDRRFWPDDDDTEGPGGGDDPWDKPYGPQPGDEMEWDEDEAHENIHALSAEWMIDGRDDWGEPEYVPDDWDAIDNNDSPLAENDEEGIGGIAQAVQMFRAQDPDWGMPPDDAWEDGIVAWDDYEGAEEDRAWHYTNRYMMGSRSLEDFGDDPPDPDAEVNDDEWDDDGNWLGHATDESEADAPDGSDVPSAALADEANETTIELNEKMINEHEGTDEDVQGGLGLWG